MIVLDELGGAGVRHAFFTRRGGVSHGAYTSLNCGFGSGDTRELVAANRARAMAALDLPATALTTVFQVHGREVAVVDEPWAHDKAPKADAMVTDQPGIGLGILTADCAPILFADHAARVIGAAHAGWRGAQAGVAEATIDAMIELGARPDAIIAVIGPCIAQASYEVGPEFPKPFLAEDVTNGRFFIESSRPDHFRFDLGGYLERRLSRLGLAGVVRYEADTCRDDANFFSYRRMTLRGEPDYGRQLSVIALEE
jgi:YfiH family protein